MPQRPQLDDETARTLFLEHAAAYYDDLNATIQNAPLGKGFDHAEAFAVAQGRELIRQSLETIVQQQIDHIEKKKKRGTARSVKKRRRKNGTAATERKNK